MHLLLYAVIPAALAAVLAVCVGRERTAKVILVLSWIVPAAFGLMFLFEQELGNAFGFVLFLPFAFLPVAGALLSLAGLALVCKVEERPKGPSLVAAAVAATPALAICLL